MTYIVEHPVVIGRGTERKVDLVKLAEDLAPLLGGSVGNSEEDRGRIVVDGWGVYLGSGYGSKALKVHVSSGLLNPDHARVYRNGERPNFPDCWISPDRPLEALAKDIMRRVVEPARAVVQTQRDKLFRIDTANAKLREAAAAFEADHGGKCDPIQEDDMSCGFRVQLGNGYASGTLWNDGGVTIKNLSGFNADMAGPIFAALRAAFESNAK